MIRKPGDVSTARYLGRELHRRGISWYDVTDVAPRVTLAWGVVYPGARYLGSSLAEARRTLRQDAGRT